MILIYDVCSRLFNIFFFQAEDGIRDLVRSRGLGDVYKRQVYIGIDVRQAVAYRRSFCRHPELGEPRNVRLLSSQVANQAVQRGFTISTLVLAVSYTHLTLPTSDLV